MNKKTEKIKNEILDGDIPQIPFNCLAWDYRSKNEENKELVDTLIEKGLSPFHIGKLIFYGHITENIEEMLNFYSRSKSMNSS